MTHKDAGQAVSGEHAAEDLQPSALLRELHFALKEYGKDRVCGVPLVLIPEGLYERTMLALNSHASLSAEKEALKAELEREKAGWAEAFRLGVHHQDRAEKLSAENATLREQRDAMQASLATAVDLYENYGLVAGLRYGEPGKWINEARLLLYRKGP